MADRWAMDTRVDSAKEIGGWMGRWKDGWKAGRPDAYAHGMDKRTEKIHARGMAGQADKWVRRMAAIRATDFLWAISVF